MLPTSTLGSVMLSLAVGAGLSACLGTAPPASQRRGSGATASLALEDGIDRPGSDFRDFDLAAANPGLCRDACAANDRCVAFTYVKPGVQGPSARCWLKDVVPVKVTSDCCVSGVKAGLYLQGKKQAGASE